MIISSRKVQSLNPKQYCPSRPGGAVGCFYQPCEIECQVQVCLTSASSCDTFYPLSKGTWAVVRTRRVLPCILPAVAHVQEGLGLSIGNASACSKISFPY